MSDVDARLAAAEDTVERVAILRDVLNDREDRIAELQAKRDCLEEEREAVKGRLAEAIAPHSVLDAEELVERLTLDELREKEPDAADTTATLADVEPTIQAGAADTVRTAALSASDSERVAELEARLKDLPDRDRGVVAKERERIETELAGLRGG
jgi:hypothetical protein